MCTNIQIDAAGPVVRLEGPTRTLFEPRNCRESRKDHSLVSALSRAPAFPSLHSFGSACVIQIPRFRLFSRVFGFSFSSDSTSSEQVGRSNNPLSNTLLQSCCCLGSRCCCMLVSGCFLPFSFFRMWACCCLFPVSCSFLWACCCCLLVSYHSPWACCCCLLVPAAAAAVAACTEHRYHFDGPAGPGCCRCSRSRTTPPPHPCPALSLSPSPPCAPRRAFRARYRRRGETSHHPSPLQALPPTLPSAQASVSTAQASVSSSH